MYSDETIHLNIFKIIFCLKIIRIDSILKSILVVIKAGIRLSFYS